MNPLARNIVAVIVGIFFGSAVNISLIMLGGAIVKPPEGADFTTPEGLKASMHLMEARHFIFPFLAHALGTFAGAFFTALIAARHKLKLALLVGVIFMIGGIANVVMVSSPGWFTALDLLAAYIPTSLLAAKIVLSRNKIGENT